MCTEYFKMYEKMLCGSSFYEIHTPGHKESYYYFYILYSCLFSEYLTGKWKSVLKAGYYCFYRHSAAIWAKRLDVRVAAMIITCYLLTLLYSLCHCEHTHQQQPEINYRETSGPSPLLLSRYRCNLLAHRKSIETSGANLTIWCQFGLDPSPSHTPQSRALTHTHTCTQLNDQLHQSLLRRTESSPSVLLANAHTDTHTAMNIYAQTHPNFWFIHARTNTHIHLHTPWCRP